MSRKIEFGLYCNGNHVDHDLMYNELMLLLTPLGYLANNNNLIYKVVNYSIDHFTVEQEFLSNMTTVAVNYPLLRINVNIVANAVVFN